METTRPVVPIRDSRNVVSVPIVVAVLMWFATAIASRRFSGDDNWAGPYALFSLLLLLAAATSAGAITAYTSTPKDRSVPRVAAIALAILAVASTIVAWAFVVWSVLLAAAYGALAATGPRQRRDAGWLSAALLAGLAVALVGVWGKLGSPGEYNDYSDAQGWGVTTACALATATLCVLTRHSHRESAVTSGAQQK